MQQLRAEAESSALSIARTVAADARRARGVSRASRREPGTPTGAELRGGPLAVARRGGGGEHRRAVHRDHRRPRHPPRAPRPATASARSSSTSFADALAGRETRRRGSRARSASRPARRCPSATRGTDEPVGEVSVGFAPRERVRRAAAAARRRRARRRRRGRARRRSCRSCCGADSSASPSACSPKSSPALVQNQAAVLDGVGDGVLAYGPDGVVTVANTTAARLLGTPDLVGRGIRDLDLPAPGARRADRTSPTDGNRRMPPSPSARRPRRLHRHASGLARRSRSGPHRRDPRPHRRRRPHRSARDRRRR